MFSWKEENVLHIDNNNDSNDNNEDFHIQKKFEYGKFDKQLKEQGIVTYISRLKPTQYLSICNFYLNHGNDHNDELFIVEPQFLDKISKLETYTIQLIYNDEIIGCVILFHFPVRILLHSNGEFSHGKLIDNNKLCNVVHTSFLCIHKQHRHKGLGGILIRQIIEHGAKLIPNNMLLGIHILQELKYNCPIIPLYDVDVKESYNKLHKLLYDNSIQDCNDNIIYRKCNIHNDDELILIYNFWINQDNKQIMWYPSIDHFKLWCSIFDVYYVVENNINKTNNIIYMFCLFPIKILFGIQTYQQGYITFQKFNDSILSYITQDISRYQSIIINISYAIVEASLHHNITSLIIPDMNNFPVDVLIQLNATQNSNKSYFGTYNLNFVPNINSVAYPYF